MRKRNMSGKADEKLLKTQFIEVLSNTGNATLAAKAIGLSRSSVYNYRNEDGCFAEMWDEALEIADDKLKEEARLRAVEGVDKRTYYHGKLLGVEKKYSDSLLVKLLDLANDAKLRNIERKRRMGYSEYDEVDPAKKLKEFLEGIRERNEENAEILATDGDGENNEGKDYE